MVGVTGLRPRLQSRTNSSIFRRVHSAPAGPHRCSSFHCCTSPAQQLAVDFTSNLIQLIPTSSAISVSVSAPTPKPID